MIQNLDKKKKKKRKFRSVTQDPNTDFPVLIRKTTEWEENNLKKRINFVSIEKK